MTKNVAILGFGGDCSNDLVQVSYETGTLIAQRGWILITGGAAGVFESSRQGALDKQGVALAVTEAQHKNAIQHATAILPVSATSLKRTLLVESADAAIIIGGWVGTLDLAVQLVNQKKNGRCHSRHGWRSGRIRRGLPAQAQRWIYRNRADA